MNTLKRNFGSLAVSLAELIVGILLLINPVGFTSAIIIACGIALTVFGIGKIIKYFRTEPEQAALSRFLATGLVALLGGGFCTFNSQWFVMTFPVLTLVYGAVILVTGLTKLQWTVDIIRTKRKRWFLSAISAAASILCGAVIVANPFGATEVLWMFIGISLIVEAAFDIIAAIFGNKEIPAEEA